MKTFVRLIRRYILVAVGISLLLVALGITGFLWLTVRFGLQWQENFSFSYSEIADHLYRNEAGQIAFDEGEAATWLGGYAWAMVLDDDGAVIWQYQLPESLNHRYTASEIAAFSRWYLQEYPVFCQVRAYGLLVLGMPQNSIWRYSFWTYPQLIEWILSRGGTVLIGLLLLILILCMVFSWRGTRSLQVVADGMDALAEGRTVRLSARGFAGELAEKLNQTSAQIQYRNDIIARRDTARTNWIAGVSHDIRTPLSMIMGWAEQLEQTPELPETARERAAGIRRQSERIRSLVEDLNLTSKLQYGAQPLRRKKVQAGPLLRQLVADFCNSPAAERCEVEMDISEAAQSAELQVDAALLARVVENILGNSVRHNAGTVHCLVKAEVTNRQLLLTLEDDGKGYPPRVLETLQSGQTVENAPHILGLHVVEQILQAHGGTATFCQNEPKGSKVILQLPLA